MLHGFGCQPVCLSFDAASYDGPEREIAWAFGQSGWLIVSEVILTAEGETFHTTLVAACDDNERPIAGARAARLLQCDCSHPQPCWFDPPDVLDRITDRAFAAFRRRCLIDGRRALIEHETSTARAIARVEEGAGRRVRETDWQIADLRRRRRMPGASFDYQEIIDGIVEQIEHEQDRAVEAARSELARLRHAAAREEERLLSGVRTSEEVRMLYTAHWRVHGRTRWPTREQHFRDQYEDVWSGQPSRSVAEMERVTRQLKSERLAAEWVAAERVNRRAKALARAARRQAARTA